MWDKKDQKNSSLDNVTQEKTNRFALLSWAFISNNMITSSLLYVLFQLSDFILQLLLVLNSYERLNSIPFKLAKIDSILEF